MPPQLVVVVGHAESVRAVGRAQKLPDAQSRGGFEAVPPRAVVRSGFVVSRLVLIVV